MCNWYLDAKFDGCVDVVVDDGDDVNVDDAVGGPDASLNNNDLVFDDGDVVGDLDTSVADDYDFVVDVVGDLEASVDDYYDLVVYVVGNPYSSV